VTFVLQCAHCIRGPDDENNSFEGSSEKFERPIVIKQRKKKR
jgi:hypothetical protein